MKAKQERSSVKVLWGTANLFSHRVYKVSQTIPRVSRQNHACPRTLYYTPATHAT